MPILSESEAAPTWFKVTGTQAGFEKAALVDGELYFPIEVFNITKADVVTWFTQTETGSAFIKPNGELFISGYTVVAMLEKEGREGTDAFHLFIDKLTEQAIFSTMIQQNKETENIQ
jgi:hypothetical protein